MGIQKDLLEILACPECKGSLYLTPQEDGLVCEACGILYPIVDDIPVLLKEEAKPFKRAD